MRHRLARAIAWLAIVSVLPAWSSACGDDRRPTEVPVASPPAAGPATPPSSAAPAPARRPRVVVLGDSIAAGLGLPGDQAFPAVLQQRLTREHLDFEVVNAGVSGDTSAGGLRRLDWSLEGDVRVLVLELGANDGLRGLSVEEMTRNLGTIVDRAKARGVRVVLCGMEAPPNFGPEYTRAFRAAFAKVAREHDVRFVPFVLAGVAGVPVRSTSLTAFIRMRRARDASPTSSGTRCSRCSRRRPHHDSSCAGSRRPYKAPGDR